MVSEELAETRPTSPKSMAGIIESIRFFKVMHQIFLHSPFKNFDDMRSQCKWSVIYTFAFVDWRDHGMLKCTWGFLFVKTISPKTNRGIERASLHFFKNCAWKPSNPAAADGFKVSIACAMSAISNLMSSMVTGTTVCEELGFSEGIL